MDVIDRALSAHAAIKESLKRAIRDSSGLDPETIRSDRNCEFGQWIYGQEGVLHCGQPEYQALKDTHRRFHLSAHAALCLCRAGRAAEAERSILDGDFERLSGEMKQRLVSLRKAIR